MQHKSTTSAQTQKWLIEELNPAQDDVTIPAIDVQALLSKDGSVMQINLPNMIILSAPNPFLKAGMELQFAQDERKEDFQTGIMGLVRLATYIN